MAQNDDWLEDSKTLKAWFRKEQSQVSADLAETIRQINAAKRRLEVTRDLRVKTEREKKRRAVAAKIEKDARDVVDTFGPANSGAIISKDTTGL